MTAAVSGPYVPLAKRGADVKAMIAFAQVQRAQGLSISQIRVALNIRFQQAVSQATVSKLVAGDYCEVRPVSTGREKPMPLEKLDAEVRRLEKDGDAVAAKNGWRCTHGCFALNHGAACNQCGRPR